MKTRNVVLLALTGAIGGLVALVAIVAGFFYFAANGIGARQPTADEKKLIITASTMRAYTDGVDPKCERLTATRALDGVRTIEAEYECDGESALVYTSTAEIARSSREARETYRLGVAAYGLGARIGGVKIHPAAALLPIGDERFAAELRKDGNPVGNVFVLRQGRIVLSLFVVGLYFDDADGARALMEPLLEEASRR